MVPKQVSYRFPGIDYCTVTIQREKVPIPTRVRCILLQGSVLAESATCILLTFAYACEYLCLCVKSGGLVSLQWNRSIQALSVE